MGKVQVHTDVKGLLIQGSAEWTSAVKMGFYTQMFNLKVITKKMIR